MSEPPPESLATMKTCNGDCGRTLAYDHFYRNATSRDGLDPSCKTCKGECRRQRRANAKALAQAQAPFVAIKRPKPFPTPRPPPDTKTCRGYCKQTLPSDNFHRSSRTPDGLHSYCKACVSENRQRNRLRDRAPKLDPTDREPQIAQGKPDRAQKA